MIQSAIAIQVAFILAFSFTSVAAPSYADCCNPTWVTTELCDYGSLPGTWAHSPFASLSYADDNTDFTENYTDIKFGSRWQTLDRNCKLKNLVEPLLSGSNGLVKSPAEGTVILFLGDSVDLYVGKFLQEHLARRYNATGKSTSCHSTLI